MGRRTLYYVLVMAWSGHPYHFTASAVVICRQHVLLVYHPRIDAWVPPGGHIEAGELPHQAAVREVFEETGVTVQVLGEPPPATADEEAFFLLSPLCLHLVKAFERGAETYHLDIAYLCCPDPAMYDDVPERLPSYRLGAGVKQVQWLRLEELPSVKLARNVAEAVDLARARLT